VPIDSFSTRPKIVPFVGTATFQISRRPETGPFLFIDLSAHKLPLDSVIVGNSNVLLFKAFEYRFVDISHSKMRRCASQIGADNSGGCYVKTFPSRASRCSLKGVAQISASVSEKGNMLSN
jgi:hypothetical protein